MFEQQYAELALAVDLIAERIRALGHPAPGSCSEFARLSSIPEETLVPGAEAMIRQLVAGQETVARTAREVFRVAEAAEDQVTMDLLTQRLQLHEKTGLDAAQPARGAPELARGLTRARNPFAPALPGAKTLPVKSSPHLQPNSPKRSE